MAAVAGTSLDNMVHGHAWAFFDMGKRVERGVFTLMLLQTMLQRQATRTRMEALLDVCDSLLTYRTRYLSSLQAAPVVDLLLTDDTNPRSLLYQVNVLMDHVRSLPRANPALRSRAEQRVITLQSSLLTADVGRACAGDGSGLWGRRSSATVGAGSASTSTTAFEPTCARTTSDPSTRTAHAGSLRTSSSLASAGSRASTMS